MLLCDVGASMLWGKGECTNINGNLFLLYSESFAVLIKLGICHPRNLIISRSQLNRLTSQANKININTD